VNEIITLPLFGEPSSLEEAKIEIVRLGTNLHEHAYILGKTLRWVRDQIGSNQFEFDWVPNNVWFGIATANNFIGFSKKCDNKGYLLEYHPKKLTFSTTPVVVEKDNYPVIIIDPPWPIQKIERYERPLQEADYKTMTVDAIKGSTFPFDDTCHVYLWTTQKYLPVAFECFEEWDIRYVCTFVWHKPGGFQPVGLPQYNCEFVLYGRKGSPKFIDTKDFNTCFSAPRGKHSEKPNEFYEMIARVTGDNRINIFSRKKREGFDGWGDEYGIQ